MKFKSNEKGQALIIITFAAVIMMGFTALAIDGARAFEDKRHAQNAADTSALAGALTYSRLVDPKAAESVINNEITTAAFNRASENGYADQNAPGVRDVTVTITNISGSVCPANLQGKEIKVDITTTINTSMARVLGRTTMTSSVTATARACGTYSGPPFPGSAIVSLAPHGKAYDGTGTPDWNITGGGIMSNSSDADAAYCNGAADITVPSVSVVGGAKFLCHGVNIGDGDDLTTGISQYTAESMAAFLPRPPACDGTASFSSGQWTPQAGKDGSKVSWTTDAHFAPGLYCVQNSPGPFHGLISGSEVTFYIMQQNFSMTSNGAGQIVATAPSSGEYKGILIFSKAFTDANGNLLNSQTFELAGNGSAAMRGSIILPSASVKIFGNGTGDSYKSQIIAYNVNSGGSSNISIEYNPNTIYQTTVPYSLSLLK